MAYKNQKKNKKHVHELHTDVRSKKSAREKRRNQPDEKLTESSLKEIMRQQGLI